MTKSNGVQSAPAGTLLAESSRTPAASNPKSAFPRRKIVVTARNIWFLERSLPLFGLLDFFPSDAVGRPAFKCASGEGKSARKLTIETDRGWSFTTDITSDSKIFRNSSRSRGTGKWVLEAGLKPGDKIVIENLGDYHYRLSKESADD